MSRCHLHSHLLASDGINAIRCQEYVCICITARASRGCITIRKNTTVKYTFANFVQKLNILIQYTLYSQWAITRKPFHVIAHWYSKADHKIQKINIYGDIKNPNLTITFCLAFLWELKKIFFYTLGFRAMYGKGWTDQNANSSYFSQIWYPCSIANFDLFFPQEFLDALICTTRTVSSFVNVVYNSHFFKKLHCNLIH